MALTAASYESPGGYRITAFGAYIGVLGNNRLNSRQLVRAYVATSGNSFRVHGESAKRRTCYSCCSEFNRRGGQSTVCCRGHSNRRQKGQLTEEVYDTAAVVVSIRKHAAYRERGAHHSASRRI